MRRRLKQAYAKPAWRNVGLVFALALVASTLLAYSRPIVMLVDGERVDSDVAPVTTIGTKVFVPLRSMADALGAVVDADSSNVSVVLGGRTLRVRVGDHRATVNGMPLTLNHAPFRIRGRVMVSLDSIARALGVHAKYDARDGRIEVVTPGIGQAP